MSPRVCSEYEKNSCFPALKLRRYPHFVAATLAPLFCISEIPFLDSWLPD